MIELRLAACANVLPPVKSVYRWEGRIEEAVEHPVLMKTTRDRYPQLEAAIRGAHPYDVPEIIAWPIETGLAAYLDWVEAETRGA